MHFSFLQFTAGFSGSWLSGGRLLAGGWLLAGGLLAVVPSVGDSEPPGPGRAEDGCGGGADGPGGTVPPAPVRREKALRKAAAAVLAARRDRTARTIPRRQP